MIKVFDLPYDKKAIFLERKNRFTGVVRLPDGKTEEVHIHDSGRLGEILFYGNHVYLKRAEGKKRRTSFDLIAGEVEGNLVFTNSMYHRRISEWVIEYLHPFGENIKVVPEYKYGSSRIDYFIKTDQGEFLVEVKGCTLAVNRVGLFPDAPTERGRRHLEELISFVKRGGNAAVMFLVFRSEAECFYPNTKTDPSFSQTFFNALESGVKSYQFKFHYDGKAIYYLNKIPLCEKFE